MSNQEGRLPDRRQRKYAAMERRMIDAGRDLIIQSGDARVSVAEIAERADVALGTFYGHFETREKFVAHFHTEAWTLLLDVVERAVLTVRTPHGSLACAIREVFERLTASDPNIRFALTVEDDVVMGPGPLTDIGLSMITTGVEQGLFTRVRDAHHALMLVRTLIRGAARNDEHTMPWQHVAGHVLAMLGTSDDHISEAVTAASAIELRS